MIPLLLCILAARLLFSIPVADAYFLQQYTFRIPRVPLELGRRHIHTPEHLAATHRMTLPHLRILETRQPLRVGNYTMITFDFSTLFGNGRATMFSCDPGLSHLFLLDSGRSPLFLARLAVGPDPENPHGHVVRAQGEFLRPPTWLERALAPAFFSLHAAENSLIFGYHVPGEDANLRAYRLAVLHGRFRESQAPPENK